MLLYLPFLYPSYTSGSKTEKKRQEGWDGTKQDCSKRTHFSSAKPTLHRPSKSISRHFLLKNCTSFLHSIFYLNLFQTGFTVSLQTKPTACPTPLHTDTYHSFRIITFIIPEEFKLLNLVVILKKMVVRLKTDSKTFKHVLVMTEITFYHYTTSIYR